MKIKFLFLLMLPIMVLGQEFEINEKSVTAIFEHDSVSKSDLYYKINKWIAKNYNSAQDVIQMSDEESGNIILKGISEIQYNNPLKYLYPKNGYIPTILNLKFNHTLEVGVKDNKYRLIFTIGEFINNPSEQQESITSLLSKFVNLNGTSEENINIYIERDKEINKSAFFGKKKQEKYYSQTPIMFKEINHKLVDYAKLLMLSLNDYVTKSSKDEDW